MAGGSKKERVDLEADESVDSGTVPALPTHIPPGFDPQAYADQAFAEEDSSEIRERVPTLTDDVATEQARVASLLMKTKPPPPRASSPDADVSIESLGTLSDDDEISLLREALSPLSRIPFLAKSLSELGALLEDSKTAYVLGFVDGVLPLETIVDVTGLPEVDTLRILDRVAVQGVIVFRSERAR
jgi:hypothetical protein